jgi:hypothetical protein
MNEQNVLKLPLPKIRRSRLDFECLAGILIVCCAIFFLLARLGHYALWDDEANTALIAEGVCETGDTSAVIGHNLVAYEGGWELKNLRERFIPPLPAYLAAASMAMLGKEAFAARLPFAICGIAFFVLVVIWLRRERADPWTWGLVGFALISNVSLILYFRQARYYGVVIFLSALLAYCYLHWSCSRIRLLLVLVAGICLFASNYLSFGALACCAAVDWCIWGRRAVRLGWREALAMFLILGMVAGSLLYAFDPFTVSRPAGPPMESNPLLMSWWKLRDMSVNEFCIVPLLILLPAVAFWRKDFWLLRGALALLVYFVAIDLVEPHHSSFAALRYYATIIPLCCVLEARTLLLAMGKRRWLAVVIGVPVFGTNVLSGSPLLHPGLVAIPLRSTFLAYLGELEDPPPDPYRTASEWINANLPANATVLVLPPYAAYPLMFHAPGQVYGWQLKWPPEGQFQSLDQIQFVGRVTPQYIVIFGREGLASYHPIRLMDGSAQGYSTPKVLRVYGKDLFRPELYLRVFAKPPLDVSQDGIFILKRS